jgi:hypothetical protein
MPSASKEGAKGMSSLGPRQTGSQEEVLHLFAVDPHHEVACEPHRHPTLIEQDPIDEILYCEDEDRITGIGLCLPYLRDEVHGCQVCQRRTRGRDGPRRARDTLGLSSWGTTNLTFSSASASSAGLI